MKSEEIIEMCVLCYCHWTGTWAEQCSVWSSRPDREPSSSASLDGVWSWDGSFDWRIWGFNQEVAKQKIGIIISERACTERDVKSLSVVLEEMGSPFCENSSNLLVLDSRGTLQVEGQLNYVFITAVGCPLWLICVISRADHFYQWRTNYNDKNGPGGPKILVRVDQF